MLGSRGHSAVMPARSEQTTCLKNLWVDYDLTYSGDSMDGVIEEIEKNRDQCPGFFRYEPGVSPVDHVERQREERRERTQWRIAKMSFCGGLLGALIGALGANLPHWFQAGWQWVEKLTHR